MAGFIHSTFKCTPKILDPPLPPPLGGQHPALQVCLILLPISAARFSWNQLDDVKEEGWKVIVLYIAVQARAYPHKQRAGCWVQQG